MTVPPILQIGDILISSDILTEEFCCDLNACKGACCIEGDAGAPVTMDEIAEIEAAYGHKMANYWLHNNFITIEGEKISKSLGNVYDFKDLAERGYSHMDYKMWVLQGHFQSERNFAFGDLKAAQQRLLNYRNFAALRWQKDTTDLD